MKLFAVKKQSGITVSAAIGLSLLGSGGATSLHAEQASGRVLEEVIVTARRKLESVQDVPISMTVLNQTQIDAANLNNAGDLSLITPSLQSNNRFGPDSTQFSIRGFTQEGRTTASVGTYFAEVIAPRGANTSVSGDGAGPGDLFDLENVQVLKGPQGTLFGRNTTGGAVVLTPVKPTDEFGGYVEASSGNYGMWRTQGVINIPMTDWARLRLGVDRMERDGYLHNRSGIGPEDMANVDYTSFRASLVLDLTESLENYTIFKATESENNATPNSLFACNPASFFGSYCVADLERRQASGTYDFYDVYSVVPDPLSEKETWQVINTTTWEVNDNFTIKNILSYAELEGNLRYDIYGTDWRQATPTGVQSLIVAMAGTSDALNVTDQKTWVEEFRLEGTAFDDRLDWQAGLYYEKSEPIDDYGSQSPAFISCDMSTISAADPSATRCNNLLFLGSISGTPGGVTYTNKAVYVQGTYSFNDQWSGTLGLRYTDDETEGYVDQFVYQYPTDYAGGYFAPSNIYTELRRPKTSSEKPTWVVGVEYTPTEDTMLYAKYSRGYRQGSVNLAADSGFDIHGPEKVDTYEIGAKTSFDYHVAGNFNIAFFYNDFTDQQLQGGYFQASGVGTTSIINAGASTIWGAEIESTLLLTDNLTLNLSYTYLNTNVDELDVPAMPPGLSNISTEFSLIQAEGDPLSFSPENQLVATASYRFPIDESLGDMNMALTYIYTDEMQATGAATSPLGVMPSYDLLNLNVNWSRIAGSAFDLSLFITNLTDEEYITNVTGNYYDLGLENGQVGVPRMYGMRLRYNFGS